jgi:thioredoxin 1
LVVLVTRNATLLGTTIKKEILSPQLTKTKRKQLKKLKMETKIKSLNEFDNLIKTNKYVLIDFYASWCGPCKMLAPIIENLSKQFQNITIVKIDVDSATELAQSQQIMSIPTLQLYADGIKVFQHVGFIDEHKLLANIKRLII